ncbi:MAG: hypothetical protein HY261_08345 [Chloroflexi bacterium]|nr:hypothetical protein [Chloroflexota bacterium]
MFKAEAITFGRLHTWTLSFYYDKRRDWLAIRAPWPAGGRWIELPDNLRIKVDPQTGDALEFQIKDFQKVFLAKRPDLQPQWEQIKPSPIALRRMENTPFIHHFLEHVQQLTYQRGEQLRPAAS